MSHRLFRVFLVLIALGRPSPAQEAGAPAPSDAPRPFFFALSVADADESASWYERVLGVRPVRRVDLEERELRIRLLRGQSTFLELVERGDGRSLSAWVPEIDSRSRLHGAFKIGFRVESLDATIRRLAELGIPLRGRVVTESDGSMRSAQIEDPDGNVLQLFEVLDESDQLRTPRNR